MQFFIFLLSLFFLISILLLLKVCYFINFQLYLVVYFFLLYLKFTSNYKNYHKYIQYFYRHLLLIIGNLYIFKIKLLLKILFLFNC